VYNRTREASTQLDEEPESVAVEPERPTLVDHYISFLLLVLIDAGLLEVRWLASGDYLLTGPFRLS
jgi:hypothetical protein